MTILFVGNTPAQLLADSGSLTFGTSTEHRDAAFVPGDIEYTVYENGGTPFGLELPSVATDFWLHYRMYAPRADNFVPMGGKRWLKVYDADDNELLRFEGDTSLNRIDVVGDTTGTSDSFPLGQQQNYTIDIHVVVDGTTSITGTVYVNGGKVGTATAANVGAKGGAARVLFENYNIVQLNSGSQDQMHLSEIIATDGESTRGWRLAQLDPAGAGALTDFSGGFAALADGDLASGVGGAADGDRMTSTLSAYGGPSTSVAVRAVVAAAVAAKGPTGPGTLKQSLRIGGTNYDGAAKALDEELAQYVEVWDNDPSTAVPWDTADFGSVELGLLANT